MSTATGLIWLTFGLGAICGGLLVVIFQSLRRTLEGFK